MLVLSSSRVRGRAILATAVATVLVGCWVPSAQAAASTSLTWRFPAARPAQGASDLLTGTVTRASAPRTITLQKWSASAWRTAVTTRTSTGRYALHIPTATPGATRYRVLAPATAGRAGATGAAFTVTVQRRTSASTSTASPSAYAFLSRQSSSTAPVARWDSCAGPIGYRVNLTNAPAGALADVTEAVKRLSAATGLSFSYKGTTTIVPTRPTSGSAFPYPGDAALVIAWARPGTSSYLPKDGSNRVGVGGALWSSGYRDGGGRAALRITQGFVVLDSTTSLTGGFGVGPLSGLSGTRGQLLMHELGHAVGLDHPKVADTAEVMNPSLTRKAAVWGAGDLAGLKLLGAGSGCLQR